MHLPWKLYRGGSTCSFTIELASDFESSAILVPRQIGAVGHGSQGLLILTMNRDEKHSCK